MRSVSEEWAIEALDAHDRLSAMRDLVREAMTMLAQAEARLTAKDRQITSLRDQVRALLGAPNDDSRQ